MNFVLIFLGMFAVNARAESQLPTEVVQKFELLVSDLHQGGFQVNSNLFETSKTSDQIKSIEAAIFEVKMFFGGKIRCTRLASGKIKAYSINGTQAVLEAELPCITQDKGYVNSKKLVFEKKGEHWYFSRVLERS